MSRVRRMLAGVSVALLLTALAAAAFVWQYFQPVAPGTATHQRFVVQRGQSVQSIAQKLHDEGFVRHPFVFRIAVKQAGLEQRLQAGSFDLSASMTPGELAVALTQGTQDVWITVLEGWRTEEIAASLSEYDLSAYDEREFLAAAIGLEGRLFPDTYLVPREITAQQLVALFTQTFERKVIDGLESELSNSDKSLAEILTMASLVEREARDYEQMRHVAGILWNRIEIGMPLQVDATLQYARGYNQQTGKWWSTPLAADRQLDSPFNTYTNQGLPPRPIANPSLNAVRATLDPLEMDDLFYIHAPSGEMYYARTLDQHNAHIQQYLR